MRCTNGPWGFESPRRQTSERVGEPHLLRCLSFKVPSTAGSVNGGGLRVHRRHRALALPRRHPRQCQPANGASRRTIQQQPPIASPCPAVPRPSLASTTAPRRRPLRSPTTRVSGGTGASRGTHSHQFRPLDWKGTRKTSSGGNCERAAAMLNAIRSLFVVTGLIRVGHGDRAPDPGAASRRRWGGAGR